MLPLRKIVQSTQVQKILGSVTIGKNSIIGANVVVTKDIPINSIVTTDTKLLIRERQIKL